MKQKTFENEEEKKKKARLSVIRYTFTNAAFSVLLSVIILVTAIAASFFSTPDPSITSQVFTGIIVFFSTMLVMTLLVIIKRMMKLFDIN
jgi:polyferredoxin